MFGSTRGALLAVVSRGNGSIARFSTFSEKEMSMKASAIIVGSLLCFTPAGISAQTVSDAQIASIVVTANQVDIDAGKLAATKATNPEVKKFGRQMVTDHTGVNKQATALVTKLKVTPEDNSTSQSLRAGGDKNIANLKSLSGAAFDRAYIDNEVTYHQAVIDAIDKTLVPSAQNAELKALLVKVRPAFVSHLEHAKMIQASLGK
jgi:putative membrane protein